MKNEVQNRREFFARAAIVGGFGAVGTLLLLRKQVCINAGVCRSCSAYVKCELPQKEKPR